MFFAASFTMVRLWKQPKCPSIDECIKKAVVHIHVEYYSAMKKKEMLSFAIAWTDLEGIMLSERYDFIYMRNLKNNINTQKIQK